MSQDHDALIALIPRLRRYARMLCADAASADDLVQDTLERACERLVQWRAGSDLRAWLFTIMHNLFVSETRRPRHRFESSIDAAHEADASAGSGDPSVAVDPFRDWGTAADLERALQTLPDAQRQVLLLIAFEDMSYAQVAAVTGVPLGTVMSRLSRARAALRAAMEGTAPGESRRITGPGRELSRPRLRIMK